MAGEGRTFGAEGELLSTCGLSVGYGKKPLVEGVDLSLVPGKIVTLIGPNGAGKSTLLKTLCAQLRPIGGAVMLTGRPIETLSSHERALAQSVLLTERLRIELLCSLDVVELGRHPHTGRLGITREEDRVRVREAMELVGVWDLRERDFMELSDGQRQRVMLARAICQEPQVLVLDEPASYLDIRHQIELLGILDHLAHECGMGIVMSLHELPLVQAVADWVLCIKDGAVMAQGEPREVFVPDVIDRLFDLVPGSFDARTGAVSYGIRGDCDSVAPVSAGGAKGVGAEATTTAHAVIRTASSAGR